MIAPTRVPHNLQYFDTLNLPSINSTGGFSSVYCVASSVRVFPAIRYTVQSSIGSAPKDR